MVLIRLCSRGAGGFCSLYEYRNVSPLVLITHDRSGCPGSPTRKSKQRRLNTSQLTDTATNSTRTETPSNQDDTDAMNESDDDRQTKSPPPDDENSDMEKDCHNEQE